MSKFWRYADVGAGPEIDEFDPEPFMQICRYCGRGQLEWYEFDTGWRLVNRRGIIHSCPEYQRAKEPR